MSNVIAALNDCIKTALAKSLIRVCDQIGGEYGYEQELGIYWWSTNNMTNVYVSTDDFKTFRVERTWIADDKEQSSVTDLKDILAVRDALMEEDEFDMVGC